MVLPRLLFQKPLIQEVKEAGLSPGSTEYARITRSGFRDTESMSAFRVDERGSKSRPGHLQFNFGSLPLRGGARRIPLRWPTVPYLRLLLSKL